MSKTSNFFTDKSSFSTIDRIRIIYLIVAVVFFFLTEFGRYVYRPFIYSNEINDFGIADSIGNSGGIIVQIFFSLAILNSNRKKAWRVICFIIVGYIIYEVLQPYLPRGIFDWQDIYGTLIGGAISAVMFMLINRNTKNKVIYMIK